MMIGHGTRSIGLEQQKQAGLFWIYAEASELPTLASWIWPESLTNKILLGRLKPSADMRPNGLDENEGLMRPELARGFLVLLLNREQRNWLTDKETELGRYVTPVEMYRQFPLAKKTVSPEQEAAMFGCWGRFKNGRDLTWMDVKDDWDEYVAKHYREPLPVLSKLENIWGDKE